MSYTFKHYQIGAKIGSGGMASVFLATDPVLGREVAIKVLHPALAMDQSYVDRFEIEARQAAALNHPNIVTIFDFGAENDTYFIVMELIRGIDLGAALKSQKPVPQEIGLAIFEEAVQGLDALHRGGLIHRDIKPANILMSRQGQVKIVDFGLTKQVGGVTGLGLTATGVIMGTAYYMSPEQSVGQRVNARSDVFSLGVTAYEMFSGQRPFEGETYSEIVHKLTAYSPPPVSSLVPTISPELNALIDRMLSKEASRRPADAEEVLNAIEHCIYCLPDSTTYLQRRKSYIQGFVASPVEYSRQRLESSIKRSLDRGRLLSTQGRERIGDAISEFESTLQLDPGNRIATEFLEKLRRTQTPAPPQNDLRVGGSSSQSPDPATKPGPGAPRPNIEVTSPGAPSSVDSKQRPAHGGSAESVPRFWNRSRAIPWAALIAIAVLSFLGYRAFSRRHEDRPSSVPSAGAGFTSGGTSTSGNGGPSAGIATQDTLGTSHGARRAEPVPRATTIVIALDSAPAGATVSYRLKGDRDFVRSGLLTPCSLELPAGGNWEIRLQKEGFDPLAQSFLLEGDRSLPPFKLVEADVTASLVVLSDPEGARIEFPGMPSTWLPRDGRLVTPAAFEEIRPGPWRLRLRQAGYVTLDTTIALRSRSETVVRVVMRRRYDLAAKPNAPALGVLVVRLDTQATISVDGGPEAAIRNYEWSDSLAAGTHRIVIRRKDGRTLEFAAKINAGEVNVQKPSFRE